MDDKDGKDWQATKMNGVVGTVDYIDSIGQVHLEGYGLALIPSLDDFTVIEEA